MTCMCCPTKLSSRNSFDAVWNVDVAALACSQTSRHNAAYKVARDSVMKTRADHIRSQLQQVSGDIRTT